MFHIPKRPLFLHNPYHPQKSETRRRGINLSKQNWPITNSAPHQPDSPLAPTIYRDDRR